MISSNQYQDIEIQFGDVVHDKSYKNDGGVVYEKKEIKHRRYP